MDLDSDLIDATGNFDATKVTINTTDDGLTMNESETLQTYMKEIGIHDLFYNSDQTAKEILLKDIPRILNNSFMYNGSELKLYSKPLTGTELESVYTEMFGSYDADATAIISATGVTSTLQKRLIDTHVKDLKDINLIQTDFVDFDTPANSAIRALYGFVGNDFNGLKYNWIDPQDIDGSHRLELLDGPSARVYDNMINFDGTFCLDMNYNMNTESGNDNSFSFHSLYDFGDEGDGRIEMGHIGTASGYKGINLKIQRDETGTIIAENTYQSPSIGVEYDSINSEGFYVVNKISDLKVWKNHDQIGDTKVSGLSEYINGNIVLGGQMIDSVEDDSNYSLLPCGYSHIGDSITEEALTEFIFAVK
jgi:hypothetical protein